MPCIYKMRIFSSCLEREGERERGGEGENVFGLKIQSRLNPRAGQGAWKTFKGPYEND